MTTSFCPCEHERHIGRCSGKEYKLSARVEHLGVICDACAVSCVSDQRRLRGMAGVALCGFCMTGHHDRCAGVVFNPGGGKNKKDSQGRLVPATRTDQVWRCTCEASPRCGASRCLDCGEVDPELIDPNLCQCLDRGACSIRVEVATTRARERFEREFGVRSVVAKETPSGSPRSKPVAVVRATAGGCLCCNEPTKGGKFLPGHDARWLSRQVQAIMDDPSSRESVEAAVKAASDALHAKLLRRIS